MESFLLEWRSGVSNEAIASAAREGHQPQDFMEAELQSLSDILN